MGDDSDPDRLDNPERIGRYDDELIEVVLDAIHDADGVAVPFKTEAEVMRPAGDPGAGFVRLTVFVDAFLDEQNGDGD